MDFFKGCGEAGRCGERTERCRWQKKRSERVAAVKILSVSRKAAQKFWAPQQDHRPLRKRNKRCNGRATARVAPTKGFVRRAKNKIVPGFCQGRCAAPWYHLASRPAHAGGLMKCRYTSALLRARPSEPKAQEALDPAAPEPCSPVRPAPAFTYSGSLGRSANGVLFPSLPF